MPTGPGGLDTEGVYLFGEDDLEALASDLLNLLGASVSTQLGLDRTRILALEDRRDRVCSLSMAALSIPNSTDQVVGGSGVAYTELSDTLGWHNPSSNPTRITPTVAGTYRVTAWMVWATNVTGVRFMNVSKAGAIITGTETAPGLQGRGYGSVVLEVPMNGTTDYLELTTRQSSGAALALTGGITVEWRRA
jgi:hypothetical protein